MFVFQLQSGHSESVYFEVEKEGVTVEDIKKLLTNAPGIVLQDNPENKYIRCQLIAVGKNEVFVGRIRKDLDEIKVSICGLYLIIY